MRTDGRVHSPACPMPVQVGAGRAVNAAGAAAQLGWAAAARRGLLRGRAGLGRRSRLLVVLAEEFHETVEFFAQAGELSLEAF